MQAMHDKLDGQGQRIEEMAKTVVTAEMVKGLLQETVSGVKSCLEVLIEESADRTEKKLSSQSLDILQRFDSVSASLSALSSESDVRQEQLLAILDQFGVAFAELKECNGIILSAVRKLSQDSADMGEALTKLGAESCLHSTQVLNSVKNLGAEVQTFLLSMSEEQKLNHRESLQNVAEVICSKMGEVERTLGEAKGEEAWRMQEIVQAIADNTKKDIDN
jgi:hypothetical protein